MTHTPSNHTPAPWHISDNVRVPYLIYGSNNYAVADCKVYHGKTDIEADMLLISAAPEMAEALNEANVKLKELHEYVGKVRKAMLNNIENLPEGLTFYDIDDIDDIRLAGLKSEEALNKAGYTI